MEGLPTVRHQANLMPWIRSSSTALANTGCPMMTFFIAFRNPIRVFEVDDLTMLIGPDRAARLLEIGVVSAEGIEFIVHAMPARDKFLR
jgi:hypothetical protein